MRVSLKASWVTPCGARVTVGCLLAFAIHTLQGSAHADVREAWVAQYRPGNSDGAFAITVDQQGYSYVTGFS